MDPHACPESLELHELRALRSDVASMTRTIDRLAANFDLLREAVLGLGGRVADLERTRERGLRTPIPLRAVSESWMPDQGDRGREP